MTIPPQSPAPRPPVRPDAGPPSGAARARRGAVRLAAWLLCGVLAGGVAPAAPAGAEAAAGTPPTDGAAAEARAATGPAPDLEALMAGMAGTPGVVARFRERKELSLLSEPIETRGTLYFAPPDRLLRTTTEPSRSRLVIAGDRFAFHDEAGGETVDLSSNPLAREFVENFIVLFNGDLAGLRERYTPELWTEGDAWRLLLRPRHRPLADVVERVTLEGSGRTLRRMEMVESDGDRTVTTFEDVEVDHRFTPAEARRLFDLSGSGAEDGAAAGAPGGTDATAP